MHTSLYIHIPWCIRKCPYCDFNSHQSPEQLPEKAYIQALIADLQQDLTDFPRRTISSIFIGGGTPSLFSASMYERLFYQLQQELRFIDNIEITLEANPGTVEQQRFREYRQLGINRLSLGIQSFHEVHLQSLGRIHNAQQAHHAIITARQAGFENINIDIMHSLPQQTIAQGLSDLQQVIQYQPEHISWYQLTLEPNTIFYKQQPSLPSEEESECLEQQGFHLLEKAGYQRYEISAFAKDNKQARHNINYWRFGDYYGIGAGAHGKITVENQVWRTTKYRQPRDYLNLSKAFLAQKHRIDSASLLFEFMLNTTRLQAPIAYQLFTKTTGLPESLLRPKLEMAANKGLIALHQDYWQITALGRRFTNDLQQMFL